MRRKRQRGAPAGGSLGERSKWDAQVANKNPAERSTQTKPQFLPASSPNTSLYEFSRLREINAEDSGRNLLSIFLHLRSTFNSSGDSSGAATGLHPLRCV